MLLLCVFVNKFLSPQKALDLALSIVYKLLLNSTCIKLRLGFVIKNDHFKLSLFMIKNLLDFIQNKHCWYCFIDYLKCGEVLLVLERKATLWIKPDTIQGSEAPFHSAVWVRLMSFFDSSLLHSWMHREASFIWRAGVYLFSLVTRTANENCGLYHFRGREKPFAFAKVLW